MDTKKLRGTLIGDYEVPGAVDNVWLDTSNPNKVLTKVFIKDKWKSIADSASTEEAIAFAEQGLAGKTDKVTDAVDGNLAALDASGNLTDSGKNISDFLSAAANTGTDGQILEYTSSGPQWANAPEGTVVVDSAMSDSSTNAIQNKVVKAYVDLKADKTDLDNYALKTGSYDTLTAGMAKNIEGQSTSTGTFLERTTANALDVANGTASVKSVKGHSVVWNQLVKNPNFTDTSYWGGNISVNNNIATLIKTATGSDINGNISQSGMLYTDEHKYFISVDILSNNDATQVCIKATGASSHGATAYTYYNVWTRVNYLWTRAGTYNVLTFTGENSLDNTKDVNFSIKNVKCFDLTLIFGAGNEPTTVAEFESWLEQNVGLKPYYDYDAGSILNNKMTGIKTLGRNLLNPTAKTARLISYSYSDNSNKFCIKDLPSGATLSFTPDATGVSASVTPDANGVFTISGTGTLTVTTDSSLADTYLCYVWDGTMNDKSEAYNVHTYPLDVTKIYGKLNGEGEYVQVYPNGMLSAGSVKDVLTKDSAVVNVGRVDLGTLNWRYIASAEYYEYMETSLVGAKNPTNNHTLANILSSIAATNTAAAVKLDGAYAIAFDNISNPHVRLRIPTMGTDGTAFKTAMSGVYLNYELATPLTYTNLVYRDDGVDTPFSLPNILVDNWSTEQAEVTAYSSNAPTSCASTLELLYGVDVANFIDSANNGTFISEDSMDAFLSALGTAMGGTWSKSWDSTNGKWTFAFTASSNFLSTGVGANGTWGVDETDHTMVLTPSESNESTE